MAFSNLNKSTMNNTFSDVSLAADVEDTISAISWSPAANHLAAASWDGKLRVYDIAVNGTANMIAMFTTSGPLFSCDWAKVSL